MIENQNSEIEKLEVKKLKSKIEELEVKKRKILADIVNGKIISVDGIIDAGRELEKIRTKIWFIEEIIYQ